MTAVATEKRVFTEGQERRIAALNLPHQLFSQSDNGDAGIEAFVQDGDHISRWFISPTGSVVTCETPNYTIRDEPTQRYVLYS